jgi:hypothetical protein
MESKMADAPDTPETDQPALLDLGPADAPAFATLVSNDGRLIRLSHDAGQIAIAIDGRKPVTLDRWQSMALRLAVTELGE